ncbi:MAG: ParA family protein [Bacteroidetes bacterium]|nr:ParA family protein [Bacteroidota bacterium]
MAKVICVLNHKGGVGKTTTTANVSAGLNILKKKVLMIDLDPQANLTVHFGFPQESENEITIYEALTGKAKLPIKNVPEVKGLDIVCSSTDDMADIELQLSGVVGREHILKELLQPVKDKYDYILIDCPPSLGIMPLNGLTSADMAIIVVEPAKFSLDGMKKIFEAMNMVQTRISHDAKDYRVLMTRYNSQKVIHKNIVEEITTRYENNVFKTIIRSNVALEEAAMQGVDIFRYDQKSNGAADYLSVCEELIKMI